MEAKNMVTKFSVHSLSSSCLKAFKILWRRRKQFSLIEFHVETRCYKIFHIKEANVLNRSYSDPSFIVISPYLERYKGRLS